LTYREPIVQNPRREIAIGIGIRRREVAWAGAELLAIEPFGIGGSDTLRGYRQDALLADSRIFDSAELRYPMQAHPRQPRSFAGDAVCRFCNVWNPKESAVLEANTLLSEGLRLR
jgi:hemolysin activation/secretion protein